jgi:RNA polymerase sigma-70 factor (ECF subfamily)
VTICRNVIRSEGRKTAVRSRKAAELADVGPDPQEPSDARVQRVALSRAVSDAVAELPPRQREVVVLRILEGHSTRECAHLLDIAEGTVKATLHHALSNLRPLLRSWNDVHLP